MGKQKMVLKLTMEDDKKRSKAMQIAVKFYGVVSAEIQGEAKDKLVVIGNGVDPVNLTTSLRKKMKVQVNVESVSGVEEKKEEKKVEVEPISYWSYDSYYNQQPYFLPPPYVKFEV